MVLPAGVCMPSNQDFPDLFETFGKFSVDPIYWIHFLKIQMFFETVKKNTKKNKANKKISLIELLCFILHYNYFLLNTKAIEACHL